MALPTNISYGTVVGQFLASLQDGSDVDKLPEGVPMTGTVTFIASPGYLLDYSASPNPVTILKTPIVCPLDNEGYVCSPYVSAQSPLSRGVLLIATDDPDILPTGWTWTVLYNLTDPNGKRVNLPTQNIYVPAGSEIDLTTVMNVAAANGVIITKGDKGDQGLPGSGDDAFIAQQIADPISSTATALSTAIETEVTTPGQSTRDILDALFLRDVSVVSYGAGLGGADDTAEIQAAVDAAAALGVGVFFPARNYTVSGTVSLSAITQPIKITIQKGAVITQTADLPVFAAEGSFGTWTNVTANITRGTRTLGVASTTGYAVGDWIQIASSNVAAGGSDKIGYLRRIVGIAGTVITFDSAVPRSLFTAQTAHIQKATLVPQIEIIGGGQVRHENLSNRKTLVNFTLVRGPKVGLELGPSGGPGATFSHCIGGGTTDEFYVHDLFDDEADTHFGYGINLGGSSRDMRFRGLGEKCRHAFTTNSGPSIPNSASYGEPENIVVDMETRDCTNKALDTHRPGWGIRFIPNHTGGSGGGIQIRSDNTHVQGGMIAGANSVGIAIASGITVMPTINGTSITNTAGAGSPAILCESPAMVSNPSIYGFTGSGIKTTSTAPGCIINNAVIDGVSAGSLIGFDIQSNDNIITLGRISNVGTGIKLAAGTTGNTYSTVAFGSGVTTQVVGP